MSGLFSDSAGKATSFAVYRLPYATQATLIQLTEGEPEALSSCISLNGKQGFVLAPFEVTDDHPILLIPAERAKITTLPIDPVTTSVSIVGSKTSRIDYSIDFANFHSQLKEGLFRKIVLARCVDEVTEQPVDPLQLFFRACTLYPRMFISLVSTPKSGCWLTATPEILLEGNGSDWRTIALAGTMRLEGEQLQGEGENVSWSTKNIQEQRYVATYIAECLEQFTSEFHEEGPSTVRAADLVHLRSDFTFKLLSRNKLGNLLFALHPTPAVCGLPKREAFQFIIHNEHTPRLYYSGFMGWLGEAETHLYVSLRCMRIEDRLCHLYAGGGLLKDSTEEQEWQETEAKLETMRRCLAIKKM